ncbi:hypothetical protein B0H10DRAFT_2225875 [Mycena sp. CBHHK59/15]|nr:hypothetical protein B0H10DRAFT_2225875 [Mycena sp. CBHHK59/15]
MTIESAGALIDVMVIRCVAHMQWPGRVLSGFLVMRHMCGLVPSSKLASGLCPTKAMKCSQATHSEPVRDVPSAAASTLSDNTRHNSGTPPSQLQECLEDGYYRPSLGAHPSLGKNSPCVIWRCTDCAERLPHERNLQIADGPQPNRKAAKTNALRGPHVDFEQLQSWPKDIWGGVGWDSDLEDVFLTPADDTMHKSECTVYPSIERSAEANTADILLSAEYDLTPSPSVQVSTPSDFVVGPGLVWTPNLK